jgi:hypothetical protein
MQQLKQIGRDFLTDLIATLIIVIPAAIAAGIVMLFPWCRSIEVFNFTFIGFAMLECLSWWIWFRTRPDPETTEEKRV